MTMFIENNSTLSVDCIIFGFDGKDLKVLLVRRRYPENSPSSEDLKLPGAMILENETLPSAASRVLKESTGLENLFLKQTSIFSSPDRVSEQELKWICDYHNINTDRVVTVGYYALVNLTEGTLNYTLRRGAIWKPVDEIHHLIMDHMDILSDALNVLQREMMYSPIAFEFLPKRFTIRQLQNLFTAVYGVEIDSRNFRKKIFSTNLLKETDEFEKNVAHKPARYYEFNRSEYKKAVNSKFKLSFLSNLIY